MVCQCCKVNEAQAVKRPLCKRCYRILKREGLLCTYPIISESKDEVLEKYVEKYGASIIDDYKSIITDTSIKLTDIAAKYGFTRERARQLFIVINGFSYTNTKRVKFYQQRIERSVEKLDPFYRSINHRGHNHSIAAQSEAKFYKICLEVGLNIYPKQDGNTFDFTVNGFNVDVKASTHSVATRKIARAQYYRFSLSEKQFSRIDFAACFVAPKETFYIIPKDSITGRFIYIVDREIGNSESIDKYSKYKGAFYLLSEIPKGYGAKRLLTQSVSQSFGFQ